MFIFNYLRVFSLAFILLTPSLSFSATPSRVAIFDTQRALQTVKEGQKAIKKLKEDWKAKESQLRKEEEKIRLAMEKFRKQSAVMGAQAKEKKEMEIRTKMMALQERGLKVSKDFQKRDQELTKPILEKLMKYVKQVSKKHKYTLVLDANRSTVVYSLSENNITNEVIKAYDKDST